jgi:multiple sugar transport system permease protein
VAVGLGRHNRGLQPVSGTTRDRDLRGSTIMNMNRITAQSLKYLLIIVLLIVALFPIYWMFVSAFRTNSELTSLPPKFLPTGGATLDNCERILSSSIYLTYYKNSLIVASSTVIISIIISVMAGYSFSRFRFFGRSAAMSGILSVQMFPIVAILISLFSFFADLQLINTYRALILADITIALPFSIWFLTSFFDTIPRELEEAAFIDGASRIRTLIQVVVPLTRPGIIAVAIYSFLMSWDDFVFGLILINKDEMRTLPVGISLSFLGEFEYDWSGMMTVSIIASVPILILFIVLNRYMVEGLTQGALKG